MNPTPEQGRERRAAAVVDEVAAMDALVDAYNTWPADLRAKLSLHDLRRMTGWTPPKTTPGPEWLEIPPFLRRNATPEECAAWEARCTAHAAAPDAIHPDTKRRLLERAADYDKGGEFSKAKAIGIRSAVEEIERDAALRASARVALPMVRERDGTFTQREPTVGSWYCGFVADAHYAAAGVGCTGPNGKPGWRDGQIARYIGEGTFHDEQDRECDFVGYDWIAEQ